MTKTKTAADQSDQSTGFPVLYSREDLHRDVVTLLLHHARMTAWIWDIQDGWALLHKDAEPRPELQLLDPDQDEHELLPYEQVRQTSFAKAMEVMYDFGYHGILDEGAEPMTYESIYMWVAAFLDDMNTSATRAEWLTYTDVGAAAGTRCLRVADLANARLVLEGREPFYYFGKSQDRDGAAVGEGGLTVRQMALLAGMEEMSIRAAANPKRANPLATYTDDDGRTRIALEVAKKWLQARGRYVPVKVRYSAGDIDLTKRKFTAAFDLIDALGARHTYLALRDKNDEQLDQAIGRLGIKIERLNERTSMDLSGGQLRDLDLMRRLAQLLELPPDLLALRAREVIAREELSQVERELRALEPK